MKKLFIAFSVLFLILLITFIKNSTKKIEDEVFVLEENIRVKKKNLKNKTRIRLFKFSRKFT